MFYFVDIASNRALEANSVYVSAMSHLSVPEWREEAEIALKDDKAIRAGSLKPCYWC